jgi:hypothetical protein
VGTFSDTKFSPKTSDYTDSTSFAGKTIYLQGGSSRITWTLTGTGGITVGATDNTYTGAGVSLILGNNIAIRGNSSNTSPLFVLEQGGSLTIGSGAEIIDNFNTDGKGGAIIARKNAELIMHGGIISNNKVYRSSGTSGGSAVYLQDDASFTMTGGTISGNTTTSHGDSHGTVYLVEDSKFTMQGAQSLSTNNQVITESGTTTGNAMGGGVFATNNSEFEMYDGTISNNIVEHPGFAAGGAVAVNSKFRFAGGHLKNNRVTSTADDWPRGGAVYVMKEMTMTGNGTITGNMASCGPENSTGETSGGGICIEGEGSLSMSGGSVTGNILSPAGSGKDIMVEGGNAGVACGIIEMKGGARAGEIHLGNYSTQCSYIKLTGDFNDSDTVATVFTVYSSGAQVLGQASSGLIANNKGRFIWKFHNATEPFDPAIIDNDTGELTTLP